jgi:Lon protease-like protein
VVLPGRELPIFELPLVLVPGERLPLHIFEERYKAMISHCLDAGEPFGVVLKSEAGSAGVGCTARVETVLERFDDGRLNILCVGEDPFRVIRRVEAERYPVGEVELLGDDPDSSGAVGDEARAAYAELVETATGERPPNEEVAELRAYDMAARVELPHLEKQELLELRSEPDRLQLVGRIFREASTRIGQVEAIRERASGNGQVTPSSR